MKTTTSITAASNTLRLNAFNAWVLVHDKDMFLTTVRRRRREVIAFVTKQWCMTWAQVKREGYRVRKVALQAQIP